VTAECGVECVELGVEHRTAVIALWERVGLTRPWNPPGADFDRAAGGATSTVLGILDGSQVVATAMVGHDGHRGWVYYVAVEPDRRAAGLGREVMHAAESWLRARSVPKVQLMVRAGNAAANEFYATLGYGVEDVRVMSRWLADTLRRATAADWAAIVALNNSEVPNVGPLDEGDGAWYLAHSEVTVLDRGGELVGMLVVMFDGCSYASPNYGWHADRYQKFAYVDRIAVRADAAGNGLGRRLYDHATAVARAAGKPVLTSEVNLDPPNERSLAFHRRYGFAQVGQQVDDRYSVTVAMFALDLT
jgi:predicted GNAT superfamily acetyltransferase